MKPGVMRVRERNKETDLRKGEEEKMERYGDQEQREGNACVEGREKMKMRARKLAHEFR